MPKELIVKSLNQLLEDAVEDECGEAEYRRGYLDGYAGVINALFALPINVVAVDSDLLTKLFAHWHKELSRWQHAPLCSHIEPPEIAWDSKFTGEKSSPVLLTSHSETSAKCLGIKV